MGLKPLFKDIADALREKEGTDEPIRAADFPARIRAIPAAGEEIALRALRIASPPEKQGYGCNGFGGEAFDPSGMGLEAELSAFSNPVFLPVGLEYVTISPEGPLPEGTEYVTISLRSEVQTVVARQPVTVRYRSPDWADVEGAGLSWQSFEEEQTTWAGFESK